MSSHTAGNQASSATPARRQVARAERRGSARLGMGFARVPVLILSEEMKAAGIPPASGFLTDIGQSGFGIISDCPVKSGSELTLSVKLLSQEAQELSVTAIWSAPLPSAHRVIKPCSDFWRIGAKLSEKITEAQRELLRNLLKFAGAR